MAASISTSSSAGGRSTPEQQHARREVKLVARHFALTLAVAFLCGCASTGQRSGAGVTGLANEIVDHGGFRLLLAGPSVPLQARFPATTLVLIDGDGQAFLSTTRVALDPTPQRSWLAAELPTLSQIAPGLFLGRPCYWVTNDDACSPRYWTTHRYGNAVRNSLAEALRTLAASGRPLLLIGYSGGGYLAARLAQTLPTAVIGLITIAAPLEPARWTEHHGYSPLAEAPSLTPNDLPQPANCQRHLFGTRDREVPPELAAAWLDRSGAGQAVEARHDCCWAPALQRALVEVLERCSAS